MVSVEDSVAVITGAASGMGAAMAQKFATEGAEVAVVDVDDDGAREVANDISQSGVAATAVHCDVSDPESVEAAVSTIVDEFGTIDVLCNNAGIFDDNAPVSDTDDDLWEGIIGVNLSGTFRLTREALPALEEGDEEGVVVNTASVAGKMGAGGGAAYTASKHGVIGLTKNLTWTHAPDIRTNAICPGTIATGMTEDIMDDLKEMAETTPSGRVADPEEIANVTVFFASDEASFMYGDAVDVDGGMLID